MDYKVTTYTDVYIDDDEEGDEDEEVDNDEEDDEEEDDMKYEEVEEEVDEDSEDEVNEENDEDIEDIKENKEEEKEEDDSNNYAKIDKCKKRKLDYSLYHCDWKDCPYNTKYKGDLAKHEVIHTGEKPHKCTHKGCTEAFSDPSSLKYHICSKHTGEKSHKCTYDGCIEAFVTACDLKRHIYTHTGEKP